MVARWEHHAEIVCSTIPETDHRAEHLMNAKEEKKWLWHLSKLNYKILSRIVPDDQKRMCDECGRPTNSALHEKLCPEAIRG